MLGPGTSQSLICPSNIPFMCATSCTTGLSKSAQASRMHHEADLGLVGELGAPAPKLSTTYYAPCHVARGYIGPIPLIKPEEYLAEPSDLEVPL